MRRETYRDIRSSWIFASPERRLFDSTPPTLKFGDIESTRRPEETGPRLCPPRRLKAVVAPADPTLRAAAQPAAASPPDRRPPAGAAVVSRFGEISPAFAAAFGASVDVGLMLGARNAEARAFSGAARHPRAASRGPALPAEISTVRALPPSRVRVALVTEPSRGTLR